jgi:predicted DCC family thiol-disulfide oxidoreductase YuxK
MTAPSLVLFDGVCNLCNASVQFLLRQDTAEKFLFASLQSNTGQKILAQYGLDGAAIQSVVLIHHGKAYTKSSAALRLAWILGGAWSLAYVFIIVPKFLRDAVYDVVARNRYRWFGKSDTCWLPTAALKARFLD